MSDNNQQRTIKIESRMHDSLINELIYKEKHRQVEGVELIASENYVSNDVLTAMGSILTNKYAEGYPGKRYYGGCEIIDEIESIAIGRLKKLYNAEYVNVQPHSGAQANMAAFMACMNPGDTFIGFELSHGGHLSHGHPMNFSGIMYNVLSYGVDPNTGLVNYDELEINVKNAEVKPKLIVAGASAYSREWDYTRLREIADSIGALLMVDMAHPAGLIAAGLLDNPLKYADIVTSTTHKTLRGPRGGIILVGKDKEILKNGKSVLLSKAINSAVFPGVQGGPLEHIIAGKAVAFGEALNPGFKVYQTNVIENARTLAYELMNRGYNVLTGGTDNHTVLIDLRTKFPDMTGKEAETILGKAGITVNKNMVPFDERSPFKTSGIRLGTAAITTRNVSASVVKQIAQFIDHALMVNNEANLQLIKNQVKDMMIDYPLHYHVSWYNH